MLQSQRTHLNNVTILTLGDPSIFPFMTTLHAYAIDTVHAYSQQLGFYPHPYLLLIPGEDRPYGGFPVDEGIIAIHHTHDPSAKPDAWWQWIIAHEIGHMYWGYHVRDGVPTTGHLGWLTIGVGVYLDRWYLTDRGLPTPMHTHLIQSFLEVHAPPEHTRFHLSREEMTKVDFDYNMVILHGKALYVIDQIAAAIGEKPFHALYRSLLLHFAGQALTWDSLWTYLTDHTGVALPRSID